MNNHIKLLCDTNQMAYGSSSALLAILKNLKSINTAFIWGVTEEILASSQLIHYSIKIDNKNIDLVKGYLNLKKFDAVLVVSNLTNLNTYLDYGIPIYYVDLHHWYPSPKTHRIWSEANRCFIERFFVKEKKTYPNQNVIEVGPIILNKKYFVKTEKIILVNIGGGENKWIKPGKNSNYLQIIIEILNLIKPYLKSYKIYIAGGRSSINTILKKKQSKDFICKTFPQNEYLHLLNKSEILFTSPGLNAVFEGLYYNKKVIFLPPQNASQIIQLKHYEEFNLVEKGLNLTEYYNFFDSLNESNFDERKLSFEVIKALNELENDSNIKFLISEHIKKQIQMILNDDYLNLQRQFLDFLGESGAKAIAKYINQDLLL